MTSSSTNVPHLLHCCLCHWLTVVNTVKSDCRKSFQWRKFLLEIWAMFCLNVWERCIDWISRSSSQSNTEINQALNELAGTGLSVALHWERWKFTPAVIFHNFDFLMRKNIFVVEHGAIMNLDIQFLISKYNFSGVNTRVQELARKWDKIIEFHAYHPCK